MPRGRPRKIDIQDAAAIGVSQDPVAKATLPESITTQDHQPANKQEAGKSFTYVCRFRCQKVIQPTRKEMVRDEKGFPVVFDRSKTVVEFDNGYAVITPKFCAENDLTMETVRELLELDPGFKKEFALLSGPGVKPNDLAKRLDESWKKKSAQLAKGEAGKILIG